MTSSTAAFRQLQKVIVPDGDALGYVEAIRPNCVGVEYHVFYWRRGRRMDAWFAETDLEAACNSTRY